MGELTKKVKETLKDAKDTVTGEDSNKSRTSTATDPLTEYESSEPMTPAKIKEHEPTAVKRDPEDIKEGVAESAEESKERLRRSGMTKGTDKA
jgi:hypothetical protein